MASAGREGSSRLSNRQEQQRHPRSSTQPHTDGQQQSWKRLKIESLPSPPPAPLSPSRPPVERKERVELGLSGKLASHALTSASGHVLKYSEPADAALPTVRYRLYSFPAAAAASSSSSSPAQPRTLYIHRQSLYSIGREPSISDLPLLHPSVSKQHAVIQYRRRGGGEVRPYLMDVGSVNGSFLNGQRVDSSRYIELREGDVLRFGQADRELVLMHEDSTSSSTSTAAPDVDRKQRETAAANGQERRAGATPAAASGAEARRRRRPAWAEDEDW